MDERLPSPFSPFCPPLLLSASQICWCSCEDIFAACLILLPPRHLARQPVVVDTKSLFIPEAKPYLKAPKRHVFPSRQILIWFARFAPVHCEPFKNVSSCFFLPSLSSVDSLLHPICPTLIHFCEPVRWPWVNGSDFNLRPPALAVTSTLPPKPLPLPPSLATTICNVEFFSRPSSSSSFML